MGEFLSGLLSKLSGQKKEEKKLLPLAAESMATIDRTLAALKAKLEPAYRTEQEAVTLGPMQAKAERLQGYLDHLAHPDQWDTAFLIDLLSSQPEILTYLPIEQLGYIAERLRDTVAQQQLQSGDAASLMTQRERMEAELKTGLHLTIGQLNHNLKELKLILGEGQDLVRLVEVVAQWREILNTLGAFRDFRGPEFRAVEQAFQTLNRDFQFITTGHWEMKMVVRNIKQDMQVITQAVTQAHAAVFDFKQDTEGRFYLEFIALTRQLFQEIQTALAKFPSNEV